MTSQNIRVKNLVMAALFTAIGVVLPQAFHMIPNAGSIILPMHIPVLICGMTVGGFYGAIAGASLFPFPFSSMECPALPHRCLHDRRTGCVWPGIRCGL